MSIKTAILLLLIWASGSLLTEAQTYFNSLTSVTNLKSTDGAVIWINDGTTNFPTRRTTLQDWFNATRTNSIFTGVTTLETLAVGNKINATNLSVGIVDNTEFDYLNNLTGNIQTQLDAKVESTGVLTPNKTLFTSPTGALTTTGTNSIAQGGTGTTALGVGLITSDGTKLISNTINYTNNTIPILTNASPYIISSIVYITNQNLGIGTNNPKARLHLPSGTATANTAPVRFTAGPLTTAAEIGAVEYDGTTFYATDSYGRGQIINKSEMVIGAGSPDLVQETDWTNIVFGTTEPVIVLPLAATYILTYRTEVIPESSGDLFNVRLYSIDNDAAILGSEITSTDTINLNQYISCPFILYTSATGNESITLQGKNDSALGVSFKPSATVLGYLLVQ